jgi:hypothetical protein
MPKGTPVEVMTPGQPQQPALAGALELATGPLHHCLGPRTTNARVRDLLPCLDGRSPAARQTRLSVAVDNEKSPKAKAVAPGLATHPRVTLPFWPTYGPHAPPSERACGDGPALGPRNHPRNRVPALIADGEDHRSRHGPWPYTRSAFVDEPAVTAAVEPIAAAEHAQGAA